jgi:hypothetical protein
VSRQIEEEWKQSALWVSMLIIQATSELLEKCLGLPSEDFLAGRKALAESKMVASLLPLVLALMEKQIVKNPKVSWIAASRDSFQEETGEKRVS